MDGKPADQHDRERFPEETKDSAARFLDRPLLDPTTSDVSEPVEFIASRIRGIDRFEVLRKWIDVEHELERGPRPRVIKLIRERHLYLEEHGERDLEGTSEPSPIESTESVAVWADRDDGERSSTFVPSRSRLSRRSARADGGEDRE